MKLNELELSSIRSYLLTQPVIKAYVFGSYARGEADEKSDVDILVDLDYSKHIGLGFISMQLQLQDILKKPVDLVSSNAVSAIIKPFIDKDKMLIYEK